MADHEAYERLHDAFVDGDVAALRAELGDPVGFPDVVAHPALGWCLVQALYSAPMAMVRELLALGADPNVDPGDGFPPLIAAVTCARDGPGAPARPDAVELVAVLLEAGADLDQRGPNDETALHVAAAAGELGLVELLLAAGADPDATTRIDDPCTALEAAEAAGHADVAARLRPLTRRLDWEAATNAGDRHAMRYLVERGHDIDATDGYSRTALMRAAHRGDLATVEWLIDHGADLDRTAKFGLSALMLAVIAGHHEVARRLAVGGADLTVTGTGAPGFSGRTAADLAGARGDHRLARELR